MKKIKLSKDQKRNYIDRIIAVLLIALVWIAVLAVAYVFAFMFDGERFILRVLLIQPFSIVGVVITGIIWVKIPQMHNTYNCEHVWHEYEDSNGNLICRCDKCGAISID